MAKRSRSRRATTRNILSALTALTVFPGVLVVSPSAADAVRATPVTAAAPSSFGAVATPTSDDGLSASMFASPPNSVKPMYRFWLPLAYTDDDVLRDELRDIAASGGGGVEIAPFVVPGAGNQSNAFLATYGWGTPLWAHKLDVITSEAADLGLVVDQNLGPAYPPTVPTLNSFNQPQAEQQLIYGKEFNPAGASRTGALPAPTTAPPSISRQLCGPATAGEEVLSVNNLGGFAAGDTITVGAGSTAEKVVVTGLGDRTATCALLTVSALKNAHAVSETVVDVARTTRIKTLVAQCITACSASGTGIGLVPSSVTDVTAQVVGGKLDYTFPEGNGNPWVVLDFEQTASGLIAQSGGYTVTQPNYVVDHWSRGGVQIQTNFWDDNILTDKVQANLDRIGGGSIFEDSLELGSTQKWTWDFLATFADKRGYDLTTLLPALAGSGIQASSTPAFELAGVGTQVREDYRQTLSDLYANRYVAPMQQWARSHGLNFRVQSYGTPIASGAAATKAGIAEGESLNFGSPNALGAEQDYRVIAGGAHFARKNLVSVECCAVFQGGYRSSLAGPNVGGQYGQGGDGTQVGGRYSQGLLDSIYKAYAGGVNQLVWHGYPYRDAPVGVGSSGRDGSWPGYHPWDIFGVLNVNDEFGPRQASWPDYAKVNQSLARTQLVLRQGRSTVDLGVYYEDLGLLGSSVGTQQSTQHMIGTSSATSKAGYTYEYVAPDFLAEPGLNVETDGGLFGDRSDQKALVLNNQTTMSVPNAQRLLELAQQGLRIFVVGDAPTSTTGAKPDNGQLATVITSLMAQPTVTQVASEEALPAALEVAGIKPTVSPETPTPGLGLVHREANGIGYEFVYNRSATTLDEDLTITGSGRPYRLDTWTGKIEPIAEYTTSPAGVTVHVRVAPYDQTIIAMADPGEEPVPAPSRHAVSSTAEVRPSGMPDALTVRAVKDGDDTTELNDGTEITTHVNGLASAQTLGNWTLNAQTWTPGANQYSTVKTDQPPVAVTADSNGKLPSWLEVTTPVDLSASSGLGTYTTTVSLPSDWQDSDGAYLSLGDVLDSVTLTVNGREITVNQSDRGHIDLGTAMHAGDNTVAVRVATTMFNAVRKSGDSNYQLPAYQRTGLMGPVVLTPYRDIEVQGVRNTEAPTITGAVRVGSIVTCDRGSWTGADTFGYAWSANGSAIVGADRAELMLGAKLVGKTLTCTVTGTGVGGQASATSSGSAVAKGSALLASARPTIKGHAKVGKTLTALPGRWSPAATSYTYVWKVNGKSIRGATMKTYRTKASDKGKRVTVTVTARNPAYANGVSVSAPVIIKKK